MFYEVHLVCFISPLIFCLGELGMASNGLMSRGHATWCCICFMCIYMI